MDTREAEMLAMVDTFLGPDYDRESVRELLAWQSEMHYAQERLLTAYEHREISAERYVTEFNGVVGETFSMCEDLLGSKDFERLFGTTAADIGGLIDLDQFLLAQHDKANPVV